MKKEMLINVLQPEECRIAIIEDGVLEELYVERTSLESFTGNIYKGRIVNLEPAIQAAFVDFSVGRNGFLHVSDVEPQYYSRHAPKPGPGDDDDIPPPPRRDRGERDRDREGDRPRRGGPRPATSAAGDDLAPPPPPIASDERGRDRGPERGPERERDRDRDRGERGERAPRERPDRSEKGRRDRSSRNFGEGLDDFRFSPPPRAIEPTPPPPPPPPPVPPPSFSRPGAPPADPERFERERERPRDEPRRRSEYAPTSWSEEPPPPPPATGFGRGLDAPEPVRSEEPPPRSRRPEPPPYEQEAPRARRPEPFEPEEPRSRRAEPFDPDLPPSRTSRHRPGAPSRPPVEPIADEPRARTTQPSIPAPREPEPEAELPPTTRERGDRDRDRGDRDPRRGRRGRGGRPSGPHSEIGADPVESRYPADRDTGPIIEPEIDPLVLEAEEMLLEPLADEPPPSRRRGGRDAIRSRGTDRERGERDRDRDRDLPRLPAPPPERSRPVSPERAPEIEPERSRPTVERPRPPAETERPRERDRDRDREPERRRPIETDRPAAPQRPAAQAPHDRDRDRDRDRNRERDRDRDREAGRPVDRAGEEGYVPRRMRSPDSMFEDVAPGWPDLEDELIESSDLTPIEDSETEEGGDDRSGRRRRRRRGRRRGEREVTRPLAEGADLEADLDADTDFEAPAPVRARGPVDEFDFTDADIDDDEFIDDDDEVVHDGERDRVVSAEEDRIDPELEEEIRKEIEEIAILEREMGLRGTTEARPRRGDAAGDAEDGGRGGKFVRGRGAVKPPIQEIFRRGDEVLIQVIKESIGTKGPTLSTYISIPGRYLVLMPGLNRVGVSRKIADEGQRRKLREIMNELNPPKGLGFIVRTAGLDRTKRELARDLAYLLRLWKVILRRIKKAKGPTPIYQESDMITRTIRDIFNAEIDTIWIDEKAAFDRAQEFLRVVMPRFVNRLKFYDEKVPLFHKYGIEEEIAKIQRRTVPLPEGGSIVIDQTEALVAIDVNSGNFRVENDAERTAYEMNLRAAKEIARQLRLRDLGGVIVNDFIDMRDERNRRGVEKALRDAIKRDRARTKILRMSQFGLIEMTRQRIRPSLKRSIYQDCTACNGQGVVKTVESMSIDVMRLLALASHRDEVKRVHVGVAGAVAAYMNNRKRQEIARIENDNGLLIHIQAEDEAPIEHLQLDCFDANNNEVRVLPPPTPTGHRRGGGHHH